MKFSVEDFFSKCDQIRRKPRIWSRLLKKSLMKNFVFRAVYYEILLANDLTKCGFYPSLFHLYLLIFLVFLLFLWILSHVKNP